MPASANTVSLQTNLNTSPYYDDFDESKNYVRILYKPRNAVQARELTQQQSIIQNQIDRFAGHIFKEGSAVRGAEISPLDLEYDYVKLRDNDENNATVNVFSFIGKIIKGNTSGLVAQVVNVSDGSQANTPNFKTIYVDYLSANSTTGFKTFANNEVLRVVTNPTQKANTITASQGGATGYGSAMRVNAGVIYAKDHFIQIPAQTIILDKYSTNPTYRVGFTIVETIVTAANDQTLLDPAAGSYNFAAPGADRLKLSAILSKIGDENTFANNFVEYVNIKTGIIQTKIDKPQYSSIRDELARRTSEESGNYIVRGLTTRVREHFNDGSNQGVYYDGNTSLLSVDVEPGKAYILGYDNELLVTQHVSIDKGIDYLSVEQVSTYADYGNYVIVDNVVGMWDLNGNDEISIRGRGVGLSGQANAITMGTFSAGNPPGEEIGKARVRGIEYQSGTPGLPSARYKLYLNDIRITVPGKSFANAECLTFNAGSGNANGKADILNSDNKNATTLDPQFTTAVFRLPAKAIRRLRDVNGNIDSDFGFYKVFNSVSFNTSGVLNLDTTSENGSSSETLSGSGALSSALARQNFTVIVRSPSANTSNLTGTITVTSGANTVTGSGTSFTTQITPGDIIACSPTDKFVVSAISNNTLLNLTRNASVSRAGAYHKRFLQGQVIDMAGQGRNGNRSITVSTSTTASLNINEPTAGFNATLIVKLNKIDAEEADKNIVRNALVEIKMGASGTTGYTANTSGPWSLGLSDGFRLVQVRKKTGTRFTSTSEGTDVTSHFVLDSGQKDDIYDHAKLVKKPGSSLSISGSDRLLVKLDYFAHANRQRGYFSVDSYPVNDAIAGANSEVIFTYQIPIFTSPTTGIAYDLRDCVDFRPRLTNSANTVTTLTNISTNPLGVDTPVYSLSSPELAEPAGGLHFPYPASLYQSDLDYYLRRKDLIVMDKDGICLSVRGVPSLNPLTPSSDADKLTLAVIDIAPYPSLPDELAKKVGRGDLACSMKSIKNDRFTMRDIGVIRDRVERLEYYTALSLLEQQTKDLTIRDELGNDRFKNGFLVDSFAGHAVGNVYDLDYKIAIDPSRKEARPSTKIDNIELAYDQAQSSSVVRTNFTSSGVNRDQIVLISNSQVNFVSGSTITMGGSTGKLRFKVDNRLYLEECTGNFTDGGTVTSGPLSATATTVYASKAPGPLITLPYKHERVIVQPYASDTRNAAGLFYSWLGTIQLDPNSDYWVDTISRPDIQINIDNNADNWEVLNNSFGTQWGSWETIASGVPVLVSSVTTYANQDDTGTTFLKDETYSTQVTQQRVGTQINSSLSTQTQTIGNVVRDVNVQPFMRSRMVKFTGRGFKPSSQLFAFFDGINVSTYITPTNHLHQPVGSESSTLYADSLGNVFGWFRIPNDNSLKFRTGDKIFRLTDSVNNSSSRGSVTTSGQTIYSSQGLTKQVSDLTVSTTTHDVSVNTLTEVRTTQEISTVINQASRIPSPVSPPPPPPSPPVLPPPPPPPMTGWNNIFEPFLGGSGFNPLPVFTPLPVFPPSIGTIGGSSVLWDPFGDIFGGNKAFDAVIANLSSYYVDPICQTFVVDTKAYGKVNSSGAFITKIDLYFATKDANMPVIVELREIDSLSGYPTSKVLPYSRVFVEPAEINVSNDGSKPTPVYFRSPVYVQDQTQYGIVVIPAGNNPNYSMWISRLGENDIVSGNRISAQPTGGVLFASSNDKVYTALQEEDLKFTVYFADFSVSQTGSIIFRNERKDFCVLSDISSSDGFYRVGEVVHGETYLKGTFSNSQNLFVSNGSTYVQGMTSNASGIITYYSTANGDMRLKNVSTASKFAGGEAIRIRLQSPTGTIVGNSTGGIKFASYPIGRVALYDTSTTANTYLHIANVAFSNSGPSAGSSANNKAFLSNRWIRGQYDGTTARIVALKSLNADLINVKGDYITPSNTSIKIAGKFATSINTKDANFIDINLNGDTEFSQRRYIHSRSLESNTSLTSASMASGSSQIRINLVSNNRYASPVFDVTRISATTIENLVNNDSTGEANTASGGNAMARYITRRVTLAEGQDAEDLKVYVDAYNPPGSDIKVYYKVLHREDSDTFAKAKWYEMERVTPTTTVSSFENRNDFRELEFAVPEYGSKNSGLFGNTVPSGILSYRNSTKAFFQGYKYFAIKIVLLGTNTTNPPRIKNPRAIALQK